LAHMLCCPLKLPNNSFKTKWTRVSRVDKKPRLIPQWPTREGDQEGILISNILCRLGDKSIWYSLSCINSHISALTLSFAFYRATLCVSAVCAIIGSLGCPSVRLSVCLSRWCILFSAEAIVKLRSRPDSPIILVDPCTDIQFQREPVSEGVKYMGLENGRFSTEIAVYFGNGTR